MELFLEHLKAELDTLAATPDKLNHFIKQFSSADGSTVRLNQLKLAMKFDKFEHQPSSSDEYSSVSLLIELVGDALEFAMDNGFLYREVNHFLNLFLDTLSLVIQENDTDCAFTNIKGKFKRAALGYSNKLHRPHLMSSISYINDTVLRHYRLYHYMLTQEQPVDLTTVQLPLALPAVPLPLRQAQPEMEWVRTEQLASLESRHKQREHEFKQACESATREIEDRLSNVYQIELGKVSSQSEFREEEVRGLVESLANAHLESVKLALFQSVQKQAMSLDMRTEKLELLHSKQENSIKPPTAHHQEE